MKKTTYYLSFLFLFTITNLHAQHFDFPGGNPEAPFYTMYFAGASLNNIDLSENDEIAVFDGEDMVGLFTLTQECTPENAFANVLIAWQLLNNGNQGYSPGNNVTFKCWKAEDEIEIDEFEIIYTDPYGGAWTENTFPEGENKYSIPIINFYTPKGSIAGIISDTITGEPIVNASITIENKPYSTISNSQGEYLLNEIPIGDYNLMVEANGYFSKTKKNVIVLPDETTICDIKLHILTPVLVETIQGNEEITIVWESIQQSSDGHFNFEGGNSNFPSWTIYLSSAFIDEVDLEPNDEIGIFDGNILVGAFTLTEILTPQNFLSNPLIAYSELISGPGYTPGNPISFKCWDDSEGQEFSKFDISFSDPYGGAWVEAFFPPEANSYSIVEIDFVSFFFNVYYESGDLVAENVGGPSFTDTGLDPEIEYCYYVTQILSNGEESLPSNVLCNIPLPPMAPIIIDAIPGIEEITIFWEPEEGIFNIYYENGALIAENIEDSYYTDTSLIVGEEYCYYVTQILEGGEESPPSNIYCSEPLSPPAPYLIKAEAGVEKVTLTWDPVLFENPGGEHFEFQGGDTNNNYWIIFICGAYLDGVSLRPNDEIAIFDNDSLVGVYHLQQVCTPDNMFENDLYAFSVLYGGETGYTSGDSLKFKCWKNGSETGIESIDFEYTFFDPFGDAWMGEVFPDGAGKYSCIELNFTSYYFNVYFDDGTLVAENLTEMEYVDSNLIPLWEYCYNITQIFPDQSESIPSNTKCATPMMQPHFEFYGGYFIDFIWTMYISSITLNGVDLEPGDAIAITNNDTIVGVFNLEQVCTPENIFENDFIIWKTIFLKDFTMVPGYTIGNKYYLKCWDEDEQTEASCFEVVFSNPYGDAFCGDVFPDGDAQYSLVELHFQTPSTQFVQLNTGYQISSSNISPSNENMLSVLSNNLNGNLSFVKDVSNYSVQKVGPFWVNNIGEWVSSDSYLFKMFYEDHINIVGCEICNDTPIPLNAGYQLCSYYPKDVLISYEAFSSIFSDSLDFIRNSEGKEIRKIGKDWAPGFVACSPGEGFLISMFEPDTLVYPETSERLLSQNKSPQTIHFSNVQGNALEPVWTIYFEKPENVEIGDEVALFDGEKLVGSLMINSNIELSNDLTVWSTLDSGIGYEAGNPLTFKFWDISEAKESIIDVVFANPYGDAYINDFFPETDGEYSIAEFDYVGINEDINFTGNFLGNNYPNPFKKTTRIDFGLKNPGHVSFSLLNTFGEVISVLIDRNCEEGKHSLEFNCNDLTPGIYYYKIKIESFGKIFIETKRMILIE